MAASLQGIAKILCRLSPSVLHPIRQYQSCLYRLPARPCLGLSAFAPPRHFLCQKASQPEEAADEAADQAVTEAVTEAPNPYKDKPWEYLESENYIELYGNKPVWEGYRRNHKGGIPPQKTRKTCIRAGKTCGNPCPICRDSNVIIHHQNVKLLEQFINPHTGMVYDPTRTGVCMKQQKKLNEAIKAARDCGFLSFQIPHVDFSGEDYSNSHAAVGSTPPHPTLTAGDSWYQWYGEITPDEKEVAKVRKTYKAYLK